MLSIAHLVVHLPDLFSIPSQLRCDLHRCSEGKEEEEAPGRATATATYDTYAKQPWGGDTRSGWVTVLPGKKTKKGTVLCHPSPQSKHGPPRRMQGSRLPSKNCCLLLSSAVQHTSRSLVHSRFESTLCISPVSSISIMVLLLSSNRRLCPSNRSVVCSSRSRCSWEAPPCANACCAV